jgi:hypothetical protein
MADEVPTNTAGGTAEDVAVQAAPGAPPAPRPTAEEVIRDFFAVEEGNSRLTSRTTSDRNGRRR